MDNTLCDAAKKVGIRNKWQKKALLTLTKIFNRLIKPKVQERPDLWEVWTPSSAAALNICQEKAE